MGDGIKFTDALRPFPLTPPVLNLDPQEYGEFVLPEVKEMSAAEIYAKIDECYDELWARFDTEGEGEITVDDLKKLAAEVKGRVYGGDMAMDVNEEAMEEIVERLDKTEDDKVSKEATKALIESKFTTL